MLTGFRDETFELNDFEKSLVPVFVKGLSDKLGRANAITSTKIIESLRDKKNIKLTDSRVRKIIQFIRAKRLVIGLVASSRGYFITHSPHELAKYLKSLEGRKNEIQADIDYIREHIKEVHQASQLNINYNEKIHHFNGHTQASA